MDRDWHRYARVRTAPPPARLQSDEHLLFAPELLPHVAHVRGAEERRELARRALVRYLHETDVLEVRVVNEVATYLARGEMPFTVSARDALDARKVYCDEAYHSVLAADSLSQVGEPSGPPAFMARLAAIVGRHPGHEKLIRFLFTVVTETSVSANLRILARSEVVAPAIRDFVAQHAMDEAWHATFFAGVLTSARAEVPSKLAALVPELIDAYLAPDLDAIRVDLTAVGLNPDEAERLAVVGYEKQQRDAAAPVLACFRSVGVTLDGCV